MMNEREGRVAHLRLHDKVNDKWQRDKYIATKLFKKWRNKWVSNANDYLKIEKYQKWRSRSNAISYEYGKKGGSV